MRSLTHRVGSSVIQLPSAPIEAVRSLHDKYLLQYLYWNRLSTIKLFFLNKPMTTVQCSNEITITIINMGRKFRGLGPYITQSPLGWGLPPYQVASWCIKPFGHNRNGTKLGRGSAPFSGRGMGPHLTQSHLGWGLPPCQVPSWSIQPFGHNKHGPKIWGAPPSFWGGRSGVPI